jgi:FkbM family methyltransferase
MPLTFLKNFAARMPTSWQLELRRHLYRRQIQRNVFVTDEPEYLLLSSFLSDGDWAIDIGANIGHYTKGMSDLVGAHGRVIAFEPVADTFALLAANVQSYRHQNVTLLNAAASDKTGVTGISIPRFTSGLINYYEATVVSNGDGLHVMTLALDSLDLPTAVRLVKIDAEGHELSVLKGMRQLLARDKPALIVEVSCGEVHSFLAEMGYARETLANSPNHIYRA